MQTFSKYFNKVEEDIEDIPRGQVRELPGSVAKSKVAELINIVDAINNAVDKVQHDIEQTEFSAQEAEMLKDRIAALARDLEGTRLPPDAEGLAGAATTALSGMEFPESVQHIMKEAAELLKSIIQV